MTLDLAPERQADVVAGAGIGFLFAPLYHPALRHAVWRRELGIPTTFNFLGPMANPAQPIAQAVGVADARMAPLMAGCSPTVGTGVWWCTVVTGWTSSLRRRPRPSGSTPRAP